jgi:hypothetical protein
VLGAAEYAAPPQGLYLMEVTYPEGAVAFAQRPLDRLAPIVLSMNHQGVPV